MKFKIKSIMKTIAIFALAVCMLLSSSVTTQAKTKTSTVYSAMGGYTVYIRDDDTLKELGQLYITRKISSNNEKKVTHTTTFTASRTCNQVTVYTSHKNGDYLTNTKSKLIVYDKVSASRIYTYSTTSDARKARTYGKCIVQYTE